MVHPSRSATLVCGSFLLVGLVAATVGVQAAGDLFEVEDTLRIRIEGPLTTLAAQTQDGLVWLDGSLTVLEADGTESEFDIRLKGRSVTRRRPEVCGFPPFWIDFRKKQIRDTRFDGHEKLKVVSHCRDSPTRFDQFIYKEYLVYQTYALLTDEGFRVRLLSIEYVDTDGERKSASRAAFFIEHADSVAERLGGIRMEESGIYPDQFDPLSLKRAEVFEYMIGNTDFSFEVGADGCCHNSKVVYFDPEKTGYIPLPYDFDMVGLVDPPYAKPHAMFGIDRVTQRVFRGTMAPPEVWAATFDLYLKKKDAIVALWTDFPQLTYWPRKRALKYIHGFYKILESEDETRERMIDKARDPVNVSATIDRIKARKAAEAGDDTITASP
jgi:hypothetical protein